MKQKVAYLIGAGATQGVLDYLKMDKRLTNEAIKDELTKYLSDNRNLDVGWVRNIIGSEIDIERLITICETSGSSRYVKVAEKLKSLYQKVIEERMIELDKQSDGKGTELLLPMLDMHQISGINEKLTVILTTNYEDLIEQAMQKVFGGINYSFTCKSDKTKYIILEKVPPILKLHGSFNWRSDYPISLISTTDPQDEHLWIPPGLEKRKDYYPFNVVWGRAKELLDCDILRVIGSSLSQNDWDLISLIATTQNLKTTSVKPYKIEIISRPGTLKRIKDDHGYLNLTGLGEMPEIRDYVWRTYFSAAEGKSVEPKIDEMLSSDDKITEMRNPFAFWLRAKGEYLSNIGKPINTKNGYFKDFVKREMNEMTK